MEWSNRDISHVYILDLDGKWDWEWPPNGTDVCPAAAAAKKQSKVQATTYI
jgi:hypothetical protein